MQDSTWYVIAMIVYLLAMAAIGYWSYKQTDQYDDYVLGGRGLHPFVAAPVSYTHLTLPTSGPV